MATSVDDSSDKQSKSDVKSFLSFKKFKETCRAVVRALLLDIQQWHPLAQIQSVLHPSARFPCSKKCMEIPAPVQATQTPDEQLYVAM